MDFLNSTADLSASVWSCSEVQTPEVEPAARSYIDMYITRAVADLCFGREQRAAAAAADDDDDSYIDLDELSDICPDQTRTRRSMIPRSSTMEDFRSVSREVFDELIRCEVRHPEYDLPASSPSSSCSESGYSTGWTSAEDNSGSFRFLPRPACVGEESAASSMKRIVSVASVADSDRTDFMERPMVRRPVTGQRPSKDRRRAIAKSLKRVGRKLFQKSSAEGDSKLETLAVL